MLKTILAAFAAIAASSAALPALAQECTGDTMLTTNPDGTTTCPGQLVVETNLDDGTIRLRRSAG